MTDDLVRVCFACNRISPYTLRRAPAVKARDRQVKAAPEEMHRAGLACETRAEFLKDPARLDQYAPEAIRILRIIGSMHLILFKRNRVRYLDRSGPDFDVNAETVESIHHLSIKGCDGARNERDCLLPAVAATDN